MRYEVREESRPPEPGRIHGHWTTNDCPLCDGGVRVAAGYGKEKRTADIVVSAEAVAADALQNKTKTNAPRRSASSSVDDDDGAAAIATDAENRERASV